MDVDSTLCGIDGVAWLAERRGEIVAQRVAALTAEAERGATPLPEVCGARLRAIRPRRGDVDELSRAYVATLAPGSVDAVARLRRAGVQVVIMSSSLRAAIVRLAFHLGVDLDDLHAVDARFDAVGAYTGFDASSPLVSSHGRALLLSRLSLQEPVLLVGDGTTDLGMPRSAAHFAAFTGFTARDKIVNRADFVVESFDEIATLMLA